MSDEFRQREDELRARRETETRQLHDEIAIGKAASDNRHRGWVVFCVIGVYAVAILGIGAYLVFGRRPERDSFKGMAEVLKIGVIPIVTLVIGYYFARDRN